MNSSFARFLKQFNRSFMAQLLCRWILIFTILALCAWLFFLQYDFFRTPSKNWPANDENPGVLFTLFGFPAILVASFIVALLQTKKHRQKNFQRFYWIIYFVPALILLGIDFTCYHYYAYYLTHKDEIRREKLEQNLKTISTPDFFSLAQMLEYGWGGNKDEARANILYQKACDKTTFDYNSIEACKKIKNYQKMRILLQHSDEPYLLNTLAFLYEKGWGGPKDEEKAKTLYKKACSINSYQCEYHYSYFN